MTFSNTLQPAELASALGLGLILLIALGAMLVHAPRLVRDVGQAAFRTAFLTLLLGEALLLGYGAVRLWGPGLTGRITLGVESAGLLVRTSGSAGVLVAWSEVRALVRTHAEGRDTWVLETATRQVGWDDSVGHATRLQDLILERAGLLHRDLEGSGKPLWTARWTRPLPPPP